MQPFSCTWKTKNMEKIAVERTIWIAASRERVWQAITDPAQVEQWFSPGTAWKSSGLEVGGTLSVYNPDTDSHMYVQVIELVDPPHRLILRSRPEPPETPKVTTWILEEENGGTRLILTYSGYELDPEDSRQKNMDENAVGFGLMLENIKAHIEGKSLPNPQGF